MKDPTRAALLVVVRTLIAAALVAVVVVERATIGWGHLALMLVALGGLLALLTSYNRKFR